MANIKKELEGIGLSEKEASVYIASLELGQSPVQKIAEQAGIKRATTYVIIESLINKGLVSSIEKGKKTYFVAEDPENIKRLVQKQKSEISEREEIVKDLIPELDLLFKTTGERPIVRFFEGIEGVETIRNDFSQTKYKQIRTVTNLDNVFRLFPKQFDLTKQRVLKKINTKVIYTNNKGPIKNATNSEELREARYISYKLFNFDGDITIYGSKVAITSFKKKPIAILIENDDVSKMICRVYKKELGKSRT